MPSINIVIEEKFYNKDPLSSDLGRNIIINGIQLMEELGFELFTFKKLATRINSTEASIYRYFDNKLIFLVYLTTWYWAWMEYIIDYKTHHINDNKEKIREIIKIICHVDGNLEFVNVSNIDLISLKRVVMVESDKTYLTKRVDEINSQGLFKGFKGLCHKIANVISKINPDYEYPHALVSTILEAYHQQLFFTLHLPSLTEISKDKSKSVEQQIYEFLEKTVMKLIN